MSFDEFSYVGVPPIPQLIYTNLDQNYPICLGPQARIHIPFQIGILIENCERYKPIKTWLHIIKKWDFDSKESKWMIFKIEFSNGSFEKNILF